jgi:hypothetical protein
MLIVVAGMGCISWYDGWVVGKSAFGRVKFRNKFYKFWNAS